MLNNWKKKLKDPKFLISFIALKIGSKVLIIWLISLFTSCIAEQASDATDEKEITTDSSSVEKESKFIKSSTNSLLLTISSKQAIVREEPAPSSREISRYTEASTLEYLGELTTYTTLMRIQGIDHDEPWLKVRTANGQIGWIYGGSVRFDGLSDQKLTEMVFDKRLKKTFGEELSSKIKIYQREVNDLQTTAAFRMLYKRGGKLRDQLEVQLNEALKLAIADSLPDFFWLNEALPGFLVHLINNGQSYQLYRNFADWNQLALATKEKEDDLLIAPFLIAYQTDSIEYKQADWRLSLSEEESYSLLGRGIHKNTLDAIQAAFESNSGFEEELDALKHKLLDDISLSKDFWEDQESILKELKAILDEDYSILDKEDVVELSARYKMLKNPKKYELRTNLFEGGE
jgi:hypothetical protein